MEFKKWFDLQEMPIRKMEFIPPQSTGAWNRNAKRKWKWNDQDAGILSSENGLSKFKQCWANTDHDYDFYLVRTKEGSKYDQVGEVDQAWVREKLNVNIEPNPTSISIIFTNNTGAEKMPFTCWTAAHRMGHAFQSSRGSWSSLPEWESFVKEVTSDFEHLLRKIYSYDVKHSYGGYPDQDGQKKLKTLSTQMGTMKSARTNSLRTHFEFFYELLAQYLLTKDKIQFNKPAQMLITNYAWGNPQGRYNRIRDEGEKADIDNFVSAMADDYNERCRELLTAAVGRMWVM